MQEDITVVRHARQKVRQGFCVIFATGKREFVSFHANRTAAADGRAFCRLLRNTE